MKKGIKISSTEDGLFLNDFILSFDSCRSNTVSFLSSAQNPRQQVSSRIIATEETVRILKVFQRKTNALTCQYNRPFSMGKLGLECLPSGGILGGASLYLETDGTSLLYAPLLRPKTFESLRSMQLKQAKFLVISALHPIHSPNFVRRKGEIERLTFSLHKDLQEGKRPFVFCPPVGTAQEVIYWCSQKNIPVFTHRLIHETNRAYSAFGSQLGASSLIKSGKIQEGVFLFPDHFAKRVARIGENESTYLVKKDFVGFEQQVRGYDDIFYLHLHADLEEIKTLVIPEVRPKRILFFGPYAKAYAEELKNQALAVSPIFHNNQWALF